MALLFFLTWHDAPQSRSGQFRPCAYSMHVYIVSGSVRECSECLACLGAVRRFRTAQADHCDFAQADIPSFEMKVTSPTTVSEVLGPKRRVSICSLRCKRALTDCHSKRAVEIDRKHKTAASHNTSKRPDASNCRTFNEAHTGTCARAVAGRMCSTSGSLPNSKKALCRPVPLPSESSRHLPTRSRLTSNLQVSGRPHLLSSSFLSIR